ncbi:MAG: iron ABC transporter permease [Myxococcales bacterium]
MIAARASRKRLAVVVLVLSTGLLAALALATAWGVESVDWRAVWRRGTPDHAIVMQVRLGRAVLGALVGAALAAAGVTFQTLVRNPLADPYVLGVSSGAAVGAALAIVVGGGASQGVPLALGAFGGALAALVLIYRLGTVRGRLVPHVVLLAGVVFNAFSWALIVMLASLSHPGATAEMLIWLMGSLSAPDWSRLLLAGLVIMGGLVGLVLLAPQLNALVLGDEGAHSLGVDVPRSRKLLLVTASLLTAAAVAMAGPIGFVGIIVPHVLRLVVGPDHRMLVPASALGGALFLTFCDTFTRMAFLPLGSEPPVSVLTALLGGPFFLVLLWQRRGERLF